MSSLVGLALLVGACRSEPEGLVARGTVELPEIDLAPPVPARVVTVRVEEGAQVRPGDTVALLTQADLPASLDAQRARVRTAEAQLRDFEFGARPEEIGQAEAELSGARAEAERTAKDAERIRALAAEGVVSRQQLDQAETAARVAAERERRTHEALELLRAGTRRNRIQMARAELATARASLGVLEARVADLILIAPVAGRVLSRQAEPGEFLAAGVPAVTIGETGRPYVRVYVPAGRLGEIAVGDTVAVDGQMDRRTTSDGQMDRRTNGQRAVVAAISPKAEFTPRVALTEEERADLMFGVKLDLLPPFEGLHPGLWVRAVFPAGPADGRTGGRTAEQTGR